MPTPKAHKGHEWIFTGADQSQLLPDTPLAVPWLRSLWFIALSLGIQVRGDFSHFLRQWPKMLVIAQQHQLPKRCFTISSQLHEKSVFQSVMDSATLDVVSAPLLFPKVQKPHKGLFFGTPYVQSWHLLELENKLCFLAIFVCRQTDRKIFQVLTIKQ